MTNDQIIGFIPARYASTRFPGKPLADIGGIPMVVRVMWGAERAKTLSRTVVLTDDQRIFDAVIEHEGEAMMTPESCRNGTERIAIALKEIPCDIAVNIQGDEPLITGELIDTAVQPLLNDTNIQIATLACPVADREELENPSAVKVVLDRQGFALYFSRSPIPFIGDSSFIDRSSDCDAELCLKHIGLYAYRTGVVKAVTEAEPTPLETVEKLEQLRMLELGYRIKVSLVKASLIGVDTPEDLVEVNNIFNHILK